MGRPAMPQGAHPNDLTLIRDFLGKDYVDQVNQFFTSNVIQSKKAAYTAALDGAAGSLSTFATNIEIQDPIPGFLNQLAPVAAQILTIIRAAVEKGKGIEFALELSEGSRPMEVSAPSINTGAPTVPVKVRGSAT